MKKTHKVFNVNRKNQKKKSDFWLHSLCRQAEASLSVKRG